MDIYDLNYLSVVHDLGLERLKQEDCHEFQANLGCTMRFHRIVFFTLRITNDNTHRVSLGTSLPVNFLLSLSVRRRDVSPASS